MKQQVTGELSNPGVQPSRLVSRAYLAVPERANCVLVRELEALRFLAERTGLDDPAGHVACLPPKIWLHRVLLVSTIAC